MVAPGAILPQRSMLLVSVHRDEPLAAGAVIGGPTTAKQAVDEVGPAAARQTWLPIIESLAGMSGAAIRNRTRYLGEERGTITIMYPAALTPTRCSSALSLRRWRTACGFRRRGGASTTRPGPGADFSFTTECTATGPLARMALRFGNASWDRAIDLANALAGVDRARDAAVRMGTLASGLEVETLRGVEAVIDATASDLIVWLKLQRLAKPAPRRDSGAAGLDIERLRRALEDYEFRETLLDSGDPLVPFLRRIGAYFRPHYDEIDYTDWNGAIVGRGPGSILRDAIPPSGDLPYEELAPLLGLGAFARQVVARHPSTPPEVLATLAGDDEMDVQDAVLERGDKGKDAEVRLAASRFPGIRESLAREPSLTPDALEILARDTKAEVRSYLLERDDLTPAAIATIETDPREWMRAQVKAWLKKRGR
jgi:hypothetical protein